MLGQLINGLMNGGGYALAAVGLSYTFGIARVFNFAYGTIYMLGAFTMLVLVTAGMPYYLAVLVALIVVGLGGLLLSWLTVLPAMKNSEETVLIVTFGLSAALTNLALWRFGGQITIYDPPLGSSVFRVAGAAFTGQDLLMFAVAPVVTFGLVAFMRYTNPGTRIRATAQRPELSSATGVNLRATYLAAIVLGVVLAALVGTIEGPTAIMSVFMGEAILLKAFTVAALAGMGHLWGAYIIGVLLGVFESLSVAYVSAAYTPALIYVALILVLALYPKGVFGEQG